MVGRQPKKRDSSQSWVPGSQALAWQPSKRLPPCLWGSILSVALIRPRPATIPRLPAAEHQELTAILYDYSEFAPNDELGRAQHKLRDLQPGREQEVTLLLRPKGEGRGSRLAGGTGTAALCRDSRLPQPGLSHQPAIPAALPFVASYRVSALDIIEQYA